MKKYLPYAASLLLLAACSQKPGYKVTGTVNNPDLNGQYVYLYEYGVRDATPLDSALVNNGTFVLEGEQDAPALRTLRFAPEVVAPARVAAGENAPFSASFVLENGNIVAVLDSTSSVEGTPENNDHTALQREIRQKRDEMQKAFAGVDEKNENLWKAAERKYDEINLKITEVVVNYILNHMDKQTAAKSLYEFRHNLDEDQQNNIIAQADSNFMAVPGISSMVDRLNILKKVAVGQPFTSFEMADMNGQMHELSEYVGNGKVVLIDFWASWCPPCRKDMPHLVELYKQYKNKGFDIVGISLDSNADAWAKGVKDLNITWPQLSDLKGWQNGGAAIYGVNSIPHTVLVDKDGTIIAKNLHGEDLDNKLKEILK